MKCHLLTPKYVEKKHEGMPSSITINLLHTGNGNSFSLGKGESFGGRKYLIYWGDNFVKYAASMITGLFRLTISIAGAEQNSAATQS